MVLRLVYVDLIEKMCDVIQVEVVKSAVNGGVFKIVVGYVGSVWLTVNRLLRLIE